MFVILFNYSGQTLGYKLYINKDCKNRVTFIKEKSNNKYKGWLIVVFTILAGSSLFGMKNINTSSQVLAFSLLTPPIVIPNLVNSKDTHIIEIDFSPFNIKNTQTQSSHSLTLAATITEQQLSTPKKQNTTEKLKETIATTPIQDEINWQEISIKKGDNLSQIFSNFDLKASDLYKIMSLGEEVATLNKLQLGRTLRFNIKNSDLIALEYEITHTDTLKIHKLEDGYAAEHIKLELDLVIKSLTATIKDSLFLSGNRAGLSDKLLMQLVSIYAWDIDFALDIREGDKFSIVYEEQYKNGVKIAEGSIIAAEFINQGNSIKTVRYEDVDGSADYYSDNGDAMHKKFIRTPVSFARISSHFNLKRKHPILNSIRAHRGVDYAAPIGTPVKATGNGKVTFLGTKGGYGRTITLKHGNTYSTVYAHLHRYAKKLKKGSTVKQGQIIGYVGKSGLATGPHLHYEFRVNNVHRNPLTVKLPKAKSIDKKYIPIFKEKVSPLLAELNRLAEENNIVHKEQESPIMVTSKTSPIKDEG